MSIMCTEDHLTTKHPQFGLDLVAHGSSVLLLSGAVNLDSLSFLCFGLGGLLVFDNLCLFLLLFTRFFFLNIRG